MYRSVRDNALAIEADASGCLASGAGVFVMVLALLAWAFGPAERPTWRDLIRRRPEPVVAPADPAPVASRTKARAAWDKARGAWRALRDD